MQAITNFMMTGLLMFLAASVITCTLALPILDHSSQLVPRSGTLSEDITYVLPIWEGASSKHDREKDLSVLTEMKNRLGLGGSKTKLGWSFSSWALSRDSKDASQDYDFDPANLNYMLDLAVESNLPILVHMNNGRWADCCTPNSDGGWGDLLLDFIASKPGTVMIDSAGNSQYGHNYGANYFSLSRLNKVYRDYKQRNTQDSARVISDWATAHPGLFAGVSLSSETIYPRNGVDYSDFAIQEWKMWLQNTGIYGPGGEYFGAGRVPAFQDINAFNQYTGQAFASWDSMRPPGLVVPGDVFGEEWNRWRVQMIVNHVADETLWISAAGVDRNLVYGHATPRLDDYGYADSIDTATAPNGAGGVTYYQWQAADFGRVNNALRAAGNNNWGVFELNPLSTDFETCYNNLLTLYKDGTKIICPNSWESDNANKDQYAIFESPNWGDTFGNSIKQFLTDYSNTPRNVQPVPWNPGNKVYDLYDQFSTSAQSGIDNHLEPAGSVGNVGRKSIFSHVDGVITYTITLPVVSQSVGQRINFWTSVGIKDGAGVGGDVQFQAIINGGSNLFGPSYHLHKNYWVWNRWVPMMVDLTDWAGQTITLTLHTSGSSNYGWTMWGAPAIYVTRFDETTAAGEANNLALGSPVSTKSSDGGPARLPEHITDGSGAGWSSVSHPSAVATEWITIDLQTTQSIGKVVLFARDDLSPTAGTGFPTAFEIQGADNADGPWGTLLELKDYPSPKAGDGQIFTFPSANARYVRVFATVLGGVGSESGYRFQLASAKVYA